MKKLYILFFILLFSIPTAKAEPTEAIPPMGTVPPNLCSPTDYICPAGYTLSCSFSSTGGTITRICTGEADYTIGCPSGFTYDEAKNHCDKTRRANISTSTGCKNVAFTSMKGKTYPFNQTKGQWYTYYSKYYSSPAQYCKDKGFKEFNPSNSQYCKTKTCQKYETIPYVGTICTKYSYSDCCSPSTVKSNIAPYNGGKLKGEDPYYYFGNESTAKQKCIACATDIANGFHIPSLDVAEWADWYCELISGNGYESATCKYRSIESYRPDFYQFSSGPGIYCEYYSPYPNRCENSLVSNCLLGASRKEDKAKYYYPAQTSVSYYCPSKGSYGCKQQNGTKVSWHKSGSAEKTICTCTINSIKICPINFKLDTKTGKCKSTIKPIYCIGKNRCPLPSPIIPPTIDEDIKDSKNMSCSSERETTFSDNNDLVKEDNGLCRVSCNDTIITKFPDNPFAPSVLAGMGFEYPINIQGARACKMEYYNISSWQTQVNEAVTMLNKCAKGQCCNVDALPAWTQRLDDLMQMKTDCGNAKAKWTAESFDVNGDSIYATISDKSADDNIAKYKKDTENSTSSVISNDTSTSNYTISTCADEDCNTIGSSSGTMTNWNMNFAFNNNYIFKNYYYISKYTGEITTEMSGDANLYYLGGNKYFTDIHQRTGSYTLNPTIENMLNKWSINMNCYYDLDNKISPPNDDIHYPDWGNTAFMFREISLDNPFPNREARSNWLGKEENITKEGDKVYQAGHIQYFVTLSPLERQSIRSYNKLHNYNNFSLDQYERSTFINDNSQIFKVRKK